MLFFLFKEIKNKIKLYLFKYKWKIGNSHNFTSVSKLFPFDKVKVGDKTYGVLNVYYYGSMREELNIGSYVSISSGVKFLLGGEHLTNTISTYPFKVKLLGFKTESLSKGMITVEDDVWIGMDAKILSGVKIGKGAIVAAGSVVTKNVEPYTIVGGVPAKFIKSRIPNDYIDTLCDFDLHNLELIVRENTDLIYSKLDTLTLDSILRETNKINKDND